MIIEQENENKDTLINSDAIVTVWIKWWTFLKYRRPINLNSWYNKWFGKHNYIIKSPDNSDRIIVEKCYLSLLQRSIEDFLCEESGIFYFRNHDKWGMFATRKNAFADVQKAFHEMTQAPSRIFTGGQFKKGISYFSCTTTCSW